MAAHEVSTTEEQITILDQPRIYLATKGPIYDKSGVLMGLFGISRDISELRQSERERQLLEQQMQHAQRLESLGVLTGGIAHDFNNILAVIIGHCCLAQMDAERAETSLAEIEMAAERAADLCRQMLAYAGKAQFVQEKLRFRELVDEMIKMLKPTISQKVTLRLDCAGDLPAIYGDASQLRQIVMNLVINAAEAIGKEQGEVWLSIIRSVIAEGGAERDHLGKPIKAGSYLCLEVTDNGCGMSEETGRRIFEPFYTTKFTGRGLGMSAVLGIIAAHQGALQFFSQPGHGTSFKVYLPVQEGDDHAKEQPEPADASAQGFGDGTVLLVEDEEQVRAVARAMLESFGFSVLEAADGKEALELYRGRSAEVAMVVTDMGMPVLDGYELVVELKKIAPALPIIVTSGFGEAEVASRIPPGQIAGLIGKPYNLSQFRGVVKSILGSLAARAPDTATGAKPGERDDLR
jgi:signal transduction histidine kinase